MVKIAHARYSEHKSKYGSAGDQTRGEVAITEWYNAGWTTVLRPINASVRESIANAAEAGCKNDNIGYSQASGVNGRTSLFNLAKKCGFNLTKVAKKCNCDCSSFVAVCVNAARISVSKDMYTGNEVSLLMKTGAFLQLNTEKYTKSDKYLLRGDILHKNGHTAMVIESRSYDDLQPAEHFNKSIAGTYKAITAVYMRYGAGKEYSIKTVIPKGAQVTNYGYYNTVEGNKWLLTEYQNNGKTYTGYVSGKYLVK